MAVELQREATDTIEEPIGDRWIGADSAGLRMTPEDFCAVTEFDERYSYELIHGVLVVTPSASYREGDSNDELGFWLRLYREQHPDGKILDATMQDRNIRIGDSVREPDRLIWTGLGRTPVVREDIPTILVEFVSEGRRAWKRDYLEKRDEYLSIGVKEYWVIDPFARTMTVFTSLPDRKPALVYAENEIYRTELLPGFELNLAKLLAIGDRWKS